jgi:hypothetical protein
MTVGRHKLSKPETVTVAAVEAGVPTLVEAREMVAEFHLMIRRGATAELSPWIERARTSLVSFVRSSVPRPHFIEILIDFHIFITEKSARNRSLTSWLRGSISALPCAAQT